MAGFELPQNFTPNPESFLRRVRPRVVPPQISLSAAEPVIASLSASQAMAVRPGATGLFTGMESSRVGSTAWVRPISTVTTRTAVELA